MLGRIFREVLPFVAILVPLLFVVILVRKNPLRLPDRLLPASRRGPAPGLQSA